jgi:hypothetical protein
MMKRLLQKDILCFFTHFGRETSRSRSKYLSLLPTLKAATPASTIYSPLQYPPPRPVSTGKCLAFSWEDVVMRLAGVCEIHASVFPNCAHMLYCVGSYGGIREHRYLVELTEYRRDITKNTFY